MQKNNRRFAIMAILALIGLGLSASLSLHYFDLRSGSAALKSFCNVSEKVNCDAVTASSWAEIFPGFPLSAFAAGWFVGMLVLSFLGMSFAWQSTAGRALFAMSGIGSLFSLAYLGIMHFLVGSYCLQCLGIDLVNFAALVTAWTGLKVHPKGASDPRGQWTRIGATVAGSLLITLLFFKSFDRSLESAGIAGVSLDELAESLLSAPKVAVTQAEAYPRLGTRGAPVSIVEYSDFQCPHCRIGARLMSSLLQHFPGKIEIVFRGYPLDPACNRFVDHSMHPAACEATRVALCADRQGRFREVYETIFDKQESLRPGRPIELAQSLGIDVEKLKACTSSTEIQRMVSQSIDEAETIGVKSTPTFLINGHKVEGAYPLPVWIKVVERLLAQSASQR